MAEYICDNNAVEKSLKKLETRITDAGGWLHEKLIIVEQNGELGLHCSMPPEWQEKLVFIPAEILLPLNLIEIALAEDNLIIKKTSPELSPAQHQIFEIMFELFNLTDKIKFHKKYSPWVALAHDKETLKRLISGRPNMRFIPGFLADLQSNNTDQLIMDSFFKTRYLKLPEEKKMLMPVIDFANHHFNAAGYQYASESPQGPNLSFNHSKSIESSRESFVRYGPYDAYDLWINCGFVEASSTFVRSVPMTITLDGLGEIITWAMLGVEVTGKLPPDLNDLKFFLPEIISNNNKTLTLTHLMIPGPTAPQALLRVVAMLIKKLSPDLSDDAYFNHVKSAERQILDTNLNFYQDLQAYLKEKLAVSGENLAIQTGISMTKIQLEKLSQYKPL